MLGKDGGGSGLSRSGIIEIIVTFRSRSDGQYWRNLAIDAVNSYSKSRCNDVSELNDNLELS